MKKFIYTIAAAMTLAACSSEDNMTTGNEPENNLVSMTFTASQEGEAGTRAGLSASDKTKINWQSGDAITINGAQFSLVSGEGTETGTFSGTTAEATKYTAVYPYTGNEGYVSEGQVSDVVLPSEQIATPNSFDPQAALMMAVSSNKTLEFKNAVGFIKVTPKFDCKKIILRAADKTVPLAGKGTLKYNGGQPTIDFSNSNELSYTINLSGTITSGIDYYIAVPAVTITAKWTLTFMTTDDKIYIRQSSNPIEFERSKALNLGEFSESTPWVSGPRGIVSEGQEVDLGLSVTIGTKAYKVIFANSNLTVTGLAASATDIGDYFAWGAIEPWCTSYTYSDGSFSKYTWKDGKSNGYVLANYPYHDGSNYVKYNQSGQTLESEDDAAKVILGGDWQIPSVDIWYALGTNSTQTFDTQNSVYSFAKNGNTLSLPTTYRFEGNEISISNNYHGTYRANYVHESGNNARHFYVYYSDDKCSCYYTNFTDFYKGIVIRPVRLEEVPSGSFEEVKEKIYNIQ